MFELWTIKTGHLFIDFYSLGNIVSKYIMKE